MNEIIVNAPDGYTKDSIETILQTEFERKEYYKHQYENGNGVPTEFFNDLKYIFDKWITPKDHDVSEHLYQIVRHILWIRGWYMIP